MRIRDPIPLWAKVIWSLCLLGCLSYAFVTALLLPREPSVLIGFAWVATIYIFMAMVTVSVVLAVVVRLLRKDNFAADSADNNDVANLIP